MIKRLQSLLALDVVNAPRTVSRSRRRVFLKLRRFVWLLPFLTLYVPVIAYYLTSPTIDANVRASVQNTTLSPNPEIFAWHVVWISSGILSAAVWVLAWLVSWKYIRQNVDLASLSTRCVLLMALLWSLATVLVLRGFFGALGYPPYSLAFAVQGALDENRSLIPSEHTLLVSAITYSGPMIIFGFSAGIHVAYCSCSCLLPLGRRSMKCDFQHGSILAERMRQLQVALSIGAGVTAVGLLRQFALARMIVSVFPESSAIRIASDASLLYLGIYYTVTLACVYVPAASILRDRALRIASALSLERRNQWIDDTGFGDLHFGWLHRLLLILSPLATGIASITLGGILN